MLTDVPTPAIYRTTITHSRHVPVRHSFEYRSYSWYVDVDDLPRLPWWLRPFARFRAADHFSNGRHPAHGSLRERLSAFFADNDVAAPEGRITALLQARVFGYVFNPLSVFWCHDREGRLRHVIAELPVVTAKDFYVSPFNPVDGYYRVRAPRPDTDVDITVALHRDPREGFPEFIANMRGQRRPATTRQVAIMQLISPLAPLVVAARIRIQGIKLWLRRLPVVPR
jgi:DUF1365 family protein